MKGGKKMLKSKIKIILFTVILSFLLMICNTGIFAASGNKKVILGGDTIGLKIDTGVMIAGKYSVQTANQKVSPWKNSDIEEGDKIIAYNDHKVSMRLYGKIVLRNQSLSVEEFAHSYQ